MIKILRCYEITEYIDDSFPNITVIAKRNTMDNIDDPFITFRISACVKEELRKRVYKLRDNK